MLFEILNQILKLGSFMYSSIFSWIKGGGQKTFIIGLILFGE